MLTRGLYRHAAKADVCNACKGLLGGWGGSFARRDAGRRSADLSTCAAALMAQRMAHRLELYSSVFGGAPVFGENRPACYICDTLAQSRGMQVFTPGAPGHKSRGDAIPHPGTRQHALLAALAPPRGV